MNEWENQQIRKGVTGAQLQVVHQDSIISQFLLQPLNVDNNSSSSHLSTGALLEQAYARCSLDKPRQILLSTQQQENKPNGPRMPLEVHKKLVERLTMLKRINLKHFAEIESITTELDTIRLDEKDCEVRAPLAAQKYRFYQELRGYVRDLVECMNDKLPIINTIEKKTIQSMSKWSTTLIERRRQDVRDQAKEISDSNRIPGTAAAARKRPDDDEHHIRRTAEREGRRTRRRRDRERHETNETHLDGMSSDDEIADHVVLQYKNQLDELLAESKTVFEDASEEFSEISEVLDKFNNWKEYDLDSYKDTYFSLCLPKVSDKTFVVLP